MNLVFFLCVGVFFIKNFDITRSEHQQNETVLQPYLTDSDTNISEKLNNKSQKWIPELMDAAKMSFNMDSAISSKCKADFQLYKLHLQNQSIWAVRMLESSQWPSFGIFAGTMYSLGNYEECLLVSEYGVKGQYCLVSAMYNKKEEPKNVNQYEWPDERASVWNALKKFENMPWKVSRQKVHWAVCIPESCTSNDIEKSLNHTLISSFDPEGYQIKASVEPKLCSSQKERKFSFGFFAFWSYLSFVVILVAFGTTYDYLSTRESDKSGLFSKKASITNGCVLFTHTVIMVYIRMLLEKPNQTSSILGITKCYSIIYNIKQLTRKSADSSTVHLIKICYLIGVVWGHRTLIHLGNPSFNREGVEMATVTQDHVSLNLRTIFVIDIFVIMSGFFCYYHDFTKIKKLGLNFAIVNVFIRWTRLVPVLCIIMLFVINILPYLNDGPYWNYRIGYEADNCRQTFWYNILGVSNQFGTDKTCIYISWYISLDLQLTLIGCILLFLISKKKTFGVFLVGLIFSLSTLATSFIVYLKKYHALLPAYGHFLENPAGNEEFSKFYIATYQRLPFYLLGFGTAMIARYLKKRNYKSSNTEVFLLVILGFPIKAATLVYVGQLYDFVEPYDRIKSAWNVHLPRLICFIPDCYAMILCFASDLAFLTKWFEYHIWTVIGRLMYSFFIVHIVFQLYHSTSSTVLGTYTNTPMLWILLADVMLSLVAAFILHLLMEAPISNIVKLIMGMIYGRKPESNQEKSNQNENCMHSLEKNGEGNPTG